MTWVARLFEHLESIDADIENGLDPPSEIRSFSHEEIVDLIRFSREIVWVSRRLRRMLLVAENRDAPEEAYTGLRELRIIQQNSSIVQRLIEQQKRDRDRAARIKRCAMGLVGNLPDEILDYSLVNLEDDDA